MIPSAGTEPCPGATCCTLPREALADSEAALLEQVASLEADREGYRLVVSAALTALHEATRECDALRRQLGAAQRRR